MLLDIGFLVVVTVVLAGSAVVVGTGLRALGRRSDLVADLMAQEMASMADMARWAEMRARTERAPVGMAEMTSDRVVVPIEAARLRR
jgi:hypothetical protein